MRKTHKMTEQAAELSPNQTDDELFHFDDEKL